MRWSRRTTRLPDDARAALDLRRGERVLAAARLRGSEWVTATDQGLVGVGWRVAWSSATHAQWYDEESALSVSWLDDAGQVLDRSLVIDEPGLLPETVHERVTATIVLSRHLRVAGESGIRVVARRQPGSEDLLWQVVPDVGIDASELRAQIDATIRVMRDELGM
jgi:hypothetical protein